MIYFCKFFNVILIFFLILLPLLGGSTRRRNTATAGSRGVILPSSRPTPYVPEDLISQAQSVLQVYILKDTNVFYMFIRGRMRSFFKPAYMLVQQPS